MSPAQIFPGCVLWTRWRPRRRLEPEKSRDAQEHGEIRKLKPEEKYDVVSAANPHLLRFSLI